MIICIKIGNNESSSYKYGDIICVVNYPMIKDVHDNTTCHKNLACFNSEVLGIK